MKPSGKTRAAALAAMAFVAAPAAWAIDFEATQPWIYGSGESFSEGGYTLTVSSDSGLEGLNGAVVNGADYANAPNDSCFMLSCPVNNDTHYYAGLNDGALNVTGGGTTQAFRVSAFDASFIAATVGYLPSVARIGLLGQVAGSTTWLSASFDLPGTDDLGQYNFSTFSLAGTELDGVAFSSLSIHSCITGNLGICAWPADNQAQFALDNLVLTAVAVPVPVPEPGTWALLAAGLLGMAGLRRRSPSGPRAGRLLGTTSGAAA